MTRARDVADTQDNLGGAVTPLVAGKNFVINGDMAIAQRGTSVSNVSSTGFYCVDRFNNTMTTLGTYTVSQEADAPVGFAKSFKTLVTTANAAPTADSRSTIIYRIEGDQVQSLAFGSNSAKATTFSFWVKSNVTGTYTFEAVTGGGKDICASYSITQSGVWEKKIITFLGDVSDAIAANNGSGLALVWWLAAGSSFTSGTLNTSNWATVVSANRAVGQTNFAAATSNYFQLTGVQMEAGNVATPFTTATGTVQGELAACQRYYYRIGGSYVYEILGVGNARSTTVGDVVLSMPVTMRTAPSSIDFSSIALLRDFGSSPIAITSVAFSGAGKNTVISGCTVASGLTAGQNYYTVANNSTSAYVAVSAEL
jgi:hypothetical protein